MRFFIVSCIILFCFSFHIAQCQPPTGKDLGDTSESLPLIRKLEYYFFSNTDSAMYYANRVYQLGVQRRNYALQNHALQRQGENYKSVGDFPKSFELQFQALQLNESNNDELGKAYTHSFIGSNYLYLSQYRTALEHLLPAKQITERERHWIIASFISSNAAACYMNLNSFDSASWFNNEAKRLLNLSDDFDPRKMRLRTLVFKSFGDVCKRQRKWDEASVYYHYSLMNALKDRVSVNVIINLNNLAGVFLEKEMYDSSEYYAKYALQNSQKFGLKDFESAKILAEIFKIRGKNDSAYHYLSIAIASKDSIYGPDKFNQVQLLALDDQNKRHQLEAKQTRLRNSLTLALVGVIAGSFFVVALIQRRNSRAKQAINKQLNEQKSNLEKTLAELKSTQAQLVQSEKMASLGELTAGIAHEIQNPLNFVNNFSEVNQDLLKDLKAEMKSGNLEEADQIADDLISNEEKINHHGKRADAIVKSMLQHSHTSSGQKEPTDLNALADEYFRLAYHGLRAKDNSFNASLHTHFDASVGKVNIVPQEIGRVLLNLFNNAFYAVKEKEKEKEKEREKQKTETGVGRDNTSVVSTSVVSPADKYQPQVTVTTTKKGNQVEIRVKDNGNGIPQKITDKIFQPFFTTKPTGQGTGLGLSLAYDIINTHGGELKVQTSEGEGAEFCIQLPIGK